MIPTHAKVSAERTVCLRPGEDWAPSSDSVILEFFTRSRVGNGIRVAEILKTLQISRDSFAVPEIKERLPHYELSAEIVSGLNKNGHRIPSDGCIPAFSLAPWCDREQLNRVDSPWEARSIMAFIRGRNLEVVAVEVPDEFSAFLAKFGAGIPDQERFLELVDLITYHSPEPLRILVRTRDR